MIGSLVRCLNRAEIGTSALPRNLLRKRTWQYTEQTNYLHCSVVVDVKAACCELLLRVWLASLQPKLHRFNFRLLSGDDILRQPAHLWIPAVDQLGLRHVHCRLVM